MNYTVLDFTSENRKAAIINLEYNIILEMRNFKNGVLCFLYVNIIKQLH